MIAIGAAVALLPIAGRSTRAMAAAARRLARPQGRGQHRYRSTAPFGQADDAPTRHSEHARSSRFPSRTAASSASSATAQTPCVHGASLADPDASARPARRRRAGAPPRLVGTHPRVARERPRRRSAASSCWSGRSPATPTSCVRHLDAHGTGDAAGAPTSSYAGLLDSAIQVTQDHELLVAMQVDERRAWRCRGDGRRARRFDREDQACAVLAARGASARSPPRIQRLSRARAARRRPAHGGHSARLRSVPAARTPARSRLRPDRGGHGTGRPTVPTARSTARSGSPSGRARRSAPRSSARCCSELQAVRAVSVVLEPGRADTCARGGRGGDHQRRGRRAGPRGARLPDRPRVAGARPTRLVSASRSSPTATRRCASRASSP